MQTCKSPKRLREYSLTSPGDRIVAGGVSCWSHDQESMPRVSGGSSGFAFSSDGIGVWEILAGRPLKPIVFPQRGAVISRPAQTPLLQDRDDIPNEDATQGQASPNSDAMRLDCRHFPECHTGSGAVRGPDKALHIFRIMCALTHPLLNAQESPASPRLDETKNSSSQCRFTRSFPSILLDIKGNIYTSPTHY